ncbi:hypothetical protein L3X38_040630 [Prunus dulcis]|uniref:Uncharacterized protein n=1 Tax=Prunus dulcis TaxID=3755 RepID=A0AAD4VAY3_PRUDU|nr:hypothetical protein L3X38_040630 [Prunus dulcis]
MKVDDEQFPPPVINMVEAYFQPEEARQRRALWPKVRLSGAEKGKSTNLAQENKREKRMGNDCSTDWLTTVLQIGQINGPHPVLFSIDWGTTVGILGRGLFAAKLPD